MSPFGTPPGGLVTPTETVDQILEDPYLEHEDIYATLEYAAIATHLPASPNDSAMRPRVRSRG